MRSSKANFLEMNQGEVINLLPISLQRSLEMLNLQSPTTSTFIFKHLSNANASVAQCSAKPLCLTALK